MYNYEVTFIVDPVLSGDEIKAAAHVYEEMLKNEGCNIIHIDEMGLKPLAYPINKRSSGVYYVYEFSSTDGTIIPKLELALRRDERIMRFLTAGLDKYGVKYNADKREGLIGKVKKKVKPGKKEDERPSRDNSRDNRNSGPRPEPAKAPVAKAEPAPVEQAPVVAAPVVAAAVVAAPAVVAAVVAEPTPAPVEQAPVVVEATPIVVEETPVVAEETAEPVVIVQEEE